MTDLMKSIRIAGTAWGLYLISAVATYYLIDVGSHWGQEEKIALAVGNSTMVAVNSPKPGEFLRVQSSTKLAHPGCELSVATYIIGEDEVVSIGYIKHDEVFLKAVQNEAGVELEFRMPSNIKPGDWKLLVRGQYQCNMLHRMAPTTFSLPFVPFKVAK